MSICHGKLRLKRKRRNRHRERGDHERLPLKNCGAVGKEYGLIMFLFSRNLRRLTKMK